MHTKKTLLLYVVSILALAIIPYAAFAKIGVGVGLGKIQIDEKLTPGGIYKLPSLPVLNTGDEDGEYTVTVTYLSDQKEIKPEKEWFTFTPSKFTLKAEESKPVGVTLTLPVKARPGNYFAFLEAYPIVKAEGVAIGVAAATKLNFTVRPSSIWGALVERLRSLLEQTAPISYYVLIVIAIIIVWLIVRRYFELRIDIRKKE